MNCLNCNAEKTTDYPMCKSCETSRHFTNRNDCHCVPCENERYVMRHENELRAAIAWEEEGRLIYGWPVQAAA